jgi:hypothetical protein
VRGAATASALIASVYIDHLVVAVDRQTRVAVAATVVGLLTRPVVGAFLDGIGAKIAAIEDPKISSSRRRATNNATLVHVKPPQSH